jgi:rRNA processing protein Gar1
MKTKASSRRSEVVKTPPPDASKPVIEAPKPLQTVENTPSQAPQNDSDAENRVALAYYVDDKGAIQWERMRPKMKDAIREFVNNPEVKKQFGSVTEISSAQVEVFDPKWCGTIYDVIGKVESFFAGKMYKISPEICEQAFTYTPAEKEKLAEPTAKVINKYAPIWLVQFKDEIALAFLFVTITAVKLQLAVSLQNMKTIQEKAKSHAQAPQPIRAEIKATEETAEDRTDRTAAMA